MPAARSFSDASLPGNPVGRPRSGEKKPSRAVRALIATRRYTTAMRGRGLGGEDPGTARSIFAPGEISMHRGSAQRQLEQLMRDASRD